MKNYLLLFAAIGALCSCASTKPTARTNYVAPSTSQITRAVSDARVEAHKVSGSLAAAAIKAKTAKERIMVIEKAVADQPPILTLARELHGDIDDLTQLLLDANKGNENLKTALNMADTRIGELEPKVRELTDLLNTANDERNRAITQGQVDKRNAHKFKAIIIALAMAASVALMFGIFRFAAFAPPLLYATLGAPAAVGVALFFWLGSG